MHEICCYDSVFLIRPTQTHENTLQVILRISIFGLQTLTYVYAHKHNMHMQVNILLSTITVL